VSETHTGTAAATLSGNQTQQLMCVTKWLVLHGHCGMDWPSVADRICHILSAWIGAVH
jgi:hypothetical protein